MLCASSTLGYVGGELDEGGGGMGVMMMVGKGGWGMEDERGGNGGRGRDGRLVP